MHYIWYKTYACVLEPNQKHIFLHSKKSFEKIDCGMFGHHTCLERSIGTQDPDKVPWYVPFTLTACARVPENHLITWFWKSHFIFLKFCILVDVEQMFWLILVRLSKQSATPQTNRNVHEIVNQILGCGRIWTSNEQVISANI